MVVSDVGQPTVFVFSGLASLVTPMPNWRTWGVSRGANSWIFQAVKSKKDLDDIRSYFGVSVVGLFFTGCGP